jgi:hypothetical protein
MGKRPVLMHQDLVVFDINPSKCADLAWLSAT